ncbi:MAG TPA: carboxylesterase family protein, partial [Polyangia bacterium]|nr:carboxylesterase family protein [Polyangia bacterium]
LYDGAALAAQTNSIVVTFDYRVGPLAWLASSAFAGENTHASTGNYGLLDQLAVLGFVQRNIAAFGGDPAQVLLFGQSAGALDVCALVASPLGKGLFAGALMESGGCTAATSATAQSFADTFAAKVGCTSGDVAGCLRALDAKTVELAIPEVADIAGSSAPDFAPNADGWVLTDVPQNVLAAGQHNHVPVIIGSNEDETGQVEVTAYPNGMTSAQFTTALTTYCGGNQTLAAAVAAEYPAADYGGDPRAAYIALTSDSKFICPARSIARTLVAQQTEPVRRYQYTHTLDGAPLGATAAAEGASHGQELLMLFRQLDFGSYQASAGELSLADAIDGYWSRFAATGDPNGASAVTWPLYDAANDTVLLLDDTQAAANGVRTAQCDFWAQALGH